MARVQSLIARAGPTDANVLILGENGTGKELVARALHGASHRADAPMLTVDLGAITEDLIDSELFRSEEHTSELQSLMRISYAVFCLKKKKQTILSLKST